MTTIKPPPLHEGQISVWNSDARFKVLVCGRRWGKTMLGALACIAVAIKGGRAWWVAPTYPIAGVGWRQIKKLAAQIEGSTKNEVERTVHLPGGGWAQVKSADNPDSLRGEGLDLLVADECAFIKEPAWNEALRPALSDREGRAIFISTPKGRNWFWRLYTRGEGGEPGWQSWRFPTASNPFISPDEIAEAKRTLPERIFRQEYMAEFIEDSGTVFRRVLEAATATPRSRGKCAAIGVDWGKHDDFTVLTAIDPEGRMIAWDRFNQIDYTVQLGRLGAMIDQYQPDHIVPEMNSMGEPLVEQLQRRYGNVHGFQTTNQSKAQIIEDLVLAFERGDISIFNEPVLINELQAFEMDRLPSGMIRYAAPQGIHDDAVISLGLAWHGLKRLKTAALELSANPFYG